MAIGFGEVTMQGALGTTFSTLAAQQTAKKLGAPASSVPAAQGPQGNILKPPAPLLGVPVPAPASNTYAASVGRTATASATSSNATRLPTSGQPPVAAPAAAPTPPIAIPPPAAAVELPPLEGSPVSALVAPPSTVQQGIPASLPSEGVAFVQSSSPSSPAAPSVYESATKSPAAMIVGVGAAVAFVWYFFIRS